MSANVDAFEPEEAHTVLEQLIERGFLEVVLLDDDDVGYRITDLGRAYVEQMMKRDT